MKKFYVAIFVMLTLICSVVQANEIKSIDMDIHINRNGDAYVTETWQYYSDSGTECYHQYTDLGNSKIDNLSVMDDLESYETLENWDVDGSFEDKKYRCGINEISNGIEICWGISEYGNKEYTVNYTINNFVSELGDDSQMVYRELIPKDTAPKIANITIWSEFDYEDTLPVWGYGDYGGRCYVANGSIKMKSEDPLESNEYMTILVKFPKGTFNCSNKLTEDFEYYYNLAEKNSKKYKEDDAIIVASIGIVAVILFIECIYWDCIAEKVKVDESDIKKVKRSAPLCRDIPCGGNLERAFYISTLYKLTYKYVDYFRAILLKWLKDGLITLQPSLDEKKKAIILKSSGDLQDFDNPKEKEMYDMMKNASKNGVLSQNKFRKCCRDNSKKIFKWLKDVREEERKEIVKEGKITRTRINKYKTGSALMDEALQLSGFKKFLKQYTLMKEKEPIEVKAFEEYLIYAQIFGIVKEVQNAFKDLYPDLAEESCYGTYANLDFISTYSNLGMRSATRAYRSEGGNYSSIDGNSYSSGGGGYSSGGGRRRCIWWWR